MLHFLSSSRATLTVVWNWAVRFIGVIHYLIIVVLITPSFIIKLFMMIVLLIIIFLIIILLSDMLGGHHANKSHTHEHAIIWLSSSIALGHLVIVLFVIFFVVLVHCLVVHSKPSDTSSVIWDDVSCLKVHWLRHIGSSHQTARVISANKTCHCRILGLMSNLSHRCSWLLVALWLWPLVEQMDLLMVT